MCKRYQFLIFAIFLTPISGDGLCHMALNFQGAGQASKDLVPLAVLSTLLGGGDSFSSGGPGKGMTSKLYENVLNQHHYVASALATHFMYAPSPPISNCFSVLF